MSSNGTFNLNFNFIFIVMGGLIVLAMVMGRRSKNSHRTGTSWWVGLGVLLVVVSVFLGFTKMRMGSVKEERHSPKNAFSDAVDEFRDELRSGLDQARESIRDSLQTAQDGMEEARKAITSANITAKSKNTKSTTRVVKTTINAPRIPTSWIVEVKDRERSQSQKDVDRQLYMKAVESVHRWINERMPVNWMMHYPTVNLDWLKNHGVFQDAIEYQEELVPRSSSNVKDTLYGGTLKVSLAPEVQETLLNLGYQKLEDTLHEDKFLAQWIIFICLVGTTLLLVLIAVIRGFFVGRPV
ncbi:MAG: hypothetical protein JNJ77_10275 [Planctomycetia bacterium]|nr:hypothetical protein [Planctomycetia bacterium]